MENYCSSKNSPPSSNQNAKQWVQIQYPCAACKSLRRRCSEECLLAPHFPSTEPLRFAIVHKVFGASNVIRRLQEISEDQRADAVNSMVFEASARIRDPVYGCAGAVTLLHERNIELQEELAKAQAEIFNMQCQTADLASLNCKPMLPSWQEQDTTNFSEQQPFLDNSSGLPLEPFWAYEQVMDTTTQPYI